MPRRPDPRTLLGMGEGKTSVWVLADQLSHEANTALHAAPRGATVVMIESMRLASVHRPSRMRIALLWSAMRHFAKELRRAGHVVEYHAVGLDPSERDDLTLVDVLRQHVEAQGIERLLVMRPAGWTMFDYVRKLETRLGVPVEITPNEMFLSGRSDRDFERVPPPEFLARDLRRRYRVLVDDQGEPEGGQWHFEPKLHHPPETIRVELPRLPLDDITRDVIATVERRFPDRAGELAKFNYPVTREQALTHLEDFVEHRLPGWFEWQDTMAHSHGVIAHARLSAAMNLGLLGPLEVVARVETAYRAGSVPLDAAAGYLRGVMGWREHVHRMHHHAMPQHREANFFQAKNPLPPAYWTGETRMACLADALRRALASGYANRSERLMVLANYLLLIDCDPREAVSWFASVFCDAWEWASVPNVMGLGLFADGGRMIQRPYAASANYISKCSDFCRHCTYDPKRREGPTACPFNYLYWGFIERHRQRLVGLPRMDRALQTLSNHSPQVRESMRREATEHIAAATQG